MRRDCLVLLVLLVIAFAGRIEADSKLTSPDAALGISAVSAGRSDAPIKRLLRGEATSTDSLAATTATKLDDEEERGYGQAAKFAASAMKAKAKNDIMLWRGFGPEKALKKLSVTSRNDKNFNKFVRYYSSTWPNTQTSPRACLRRRKTSYCCRS